MEANIGDVIKIKVGGEEFDTVIDTDGVQRFVRNPFFSVLAELADLHELQVAYVEGKFPQRDYMLFLMGTGYSVSGFADLPQFSDLAIENPLAAE